MMEESMVVAAQVPEGQGGGAPCKGVFAASCNDKWHYCYKNGHWARDCHMRIHDEANMVCMDEEE